MSDTAQDTAKVEEEGGAESAHDVAQPSRLGAASASMGSALLQRKIDRRLQRKVAATGTGEKTEEERDGESAKKKVAHTSAESADKLIQESIGKMIPTLKTGKVAEGVISIVDNAAFRVAYERRYGDLDRVDSVNAFVERNHPDGGDRVWIHEKRGNAGTAIHEAMHLYSNTKMRDTWKKNANEGATEYFTRLITDPKKISRSNYNSELGAMKALVAATSQQCVANAYFTGDLETLRSAAGETKFDKWLKFVKEEDWDEAKKAFK